jgi:hypothetical protein
MKSQHILAHLQFADAVDVQTASPSVTDSYVLVLQPVVAAILPLSGQLTGARTAQCCKATVQHAKSCTGMPALASRCLAAAETQSGRAGRVCTASQ